MTTPSPHPPPPEDSVVLAEQALLGAFLHQPAHIPAALAQLTPADLYHPAHQALLTALTNRPRPGPDGHHAWITAITETAARTTRTVTPAYTHRLLHTSTHPDHAPAYLRIVLGAALRRTLATHAHRLADATRADAEAGAGPDTTLAAARELHTALHAATRRWGTTPPSPADGHQHSALGLTIPQTAETENRFLAALLQQPHHLPDITPWITPDDLTHPARQAVYRAIANLHHNGEPIDPITVTWNMPYHTPAPHRPTPDDLIHLAYTYGGDPHYLTERLLDATLLRTAAATAHAVRDAATDPVRTTDTALADVHHDLQRLATTTRRWHAWSGDTPPAARGGPISRYTPPATRPTPPNSFQEPQHVQPRR